MLLGFCYPDDGRQYFERGIISKPAFADPATMAAYKHKPKLQAAVIDILRCHFKGNIQPRPTSIKEIERAANESIKLPKVLEDAGYCPLVSFDETIGRTVTYFLFTYLDENGPPCGAACEKCQKIFLLTKVHQRFCSNQCRWDFWNARKSGGAA